MTPRQSPQPSSAGLCREEALRCRPVKNPAVVEHRAESGELILAYPAQPRRWAVRLLARLGRKPQEMQRRLQLDAIGSEVWAWIDGRRQVTDLIGRFAAVHQVPLQEAALALPRFLRDLGARGLIAMKPPPEIAGAPNEELDGN